MPRKPRGGQVGRPPLTPEGATIRKTVTLTPEQVEWLDRMPGSASEAVRSVIDMAKAIEETGILKGDWVLYQDGDTWCISPHEREHAYAANYTGATAAEVIRLATEDLRAQPRQ